LYYEDYDNKINYYNLSVFNYPYEVYLNDMKLEKEADGNYIIYPNNFTYGKNDIFFKDPDNNKIEIISIKYHEKYIVTIENGLKEGQVTNYYKSVLNIKIITKSGKVIDNIAQYINQLYIYSNNQFKKLNVKNCQLYKDTFKCTEDNIEKGSYNAYYENICKSTFSIGNYDVYNDNDQKLLSINPSYVNINDDKDIIITLQFLQKFENSILSIGFEDYKTGIINSYGINNPILDKEHNNIIYIKILNQYKIEELTGVYRIRVFFYNTQYPSFLSKMTLIVSNNISLYENKHYSLSQII
jgi:hypothetical protein